MDLINELGNKCNIMNEWIMKLKFTKWMNILWKLGQLIEWMTYENNVNNMNEWPWKWGQQSKLWILG